MAFEGGGERRTRTPYRYDTNEFAAHGADLGTSLPWSTANCILSYSDKNKNIPTCVKMFWLVSIDMEFHELRTNIIIANADDLSIAINIANIKI